MKAKLIIFMLVGVIIGMMLGGIMAPAIAQDYNYQLDDIYSILKKIYNEVSSINSNVSWIQMDMP